ncbi:MAG: hypothetical protein LBH70_05615 [Spirochaetaceae bacterium]|jgi:hypothetical protein|nr:hypothetical protein [Spirochaetaceae bacterium]
MARKEFSLLLIAVFFGFLPVFILPAQEDGNEQEIPIESDWTGSLPAAYARGDMMFTMSGGVLFPVLFLDGSTSPAKPYDSKIKLGGVGTLGFNFFLTSDIFLGVEINGGFSDSVNNILVQFPFGLRAGYQFIFRRIEVPLSVVLGMSYQSYLTKSYFGLFLKPEAGMYWRMNQAWSFGLNVGWWWVPQWPDLGPEYNRYGNFLDLTLSARYAL